jgi:transposase InsO family protein
MPWKETTVLDDRLKFIAMYLDDLISMTDLCREFRISRKTGYKFVRRYKLWGPEGLHDLSRAPHNQPNAVPEQVQELIADMRASHPTWGPRKVRALLARDHEGLAVPAASTIGAVLKRRGLVTARKRRRNTTSLTPVHLSQPDGCNDVWCADFKGHFALRNGKRCHPFTVSDSYSRMLLRCQALSNTDTRTVRPLWVATFREYGIPSAIRTDNGPPFATNGLGGLSELSIWWIKLGIRPERIRPGCPQENGRHERMHRTLKSDATAPPQSNLAAQQRVFDRFTDEYNHLRPHEALEQQTPASVYSPSPREYPLRAPTIEYPHAMRVRHVRTNGCIRWEGTMLFLSETLVGENVGFDQLDDRHWTVYFGPLLLAIIDNYTLTWAPPNHAPKKIRALLKEDTL